MEERFEAILARKLSQIEASLGALASIRMLVQGFTRFENSILSLDTCVYMYLCTFRDLKSGLSETCVNIPKGGELCQSRAKSGANRSLYLGMGLKD